MRPLVIINRQILFDVATNGKELAEAVGLPPISDEVAEMERKDSARRLHTIGRLFPSVQDHSEFLAAVFMHQRIVSMEAEGQQIDDASIKQAYDSFTHMLNAAGRSLIAILVDLGALEVTPDWAQPSEQEQE